MLKYVLIRSEKGILFEQKLAYTFRTRDFLQNFLDSIQNELELRGLFNHTYHMEVLTIKAIVHEMDTPEKVFIALVFDNSVNLDTYFMQEVLMLEQIKHYYEISQTLDKKLVLSELQDYLQKMISRILQSRPPKICILGTSQVGKTTVADLFRGQRPFKPHPPTRLEPIIFSIELFGFPISIWDLPSGIDEANLRKQLSESDGILLVLNSANGGIEEAKKLLSLAKMAAPHTGVAILANKQDLPNARAPIEINQIFGLRVYPLSAIRDEFRNPVKKIVAQLLELNIQDWDPVLDRYLTHPGISLKEL